MLCVDEGDSGGVDVPVCTNVCCSYEGKAYQPKNDDILASLSNKGGRLCLHGMSVFPGSQYVQTEIFFFICCRLALSQNLLLFARKVMTLLLLKSLIT